jgi:hypothetical protein
VVADLQVGTVGNQTAFIALAIGGQVPAPGGPEQDDLGLVSGD